MFSWIKLARRSLHIRSPWKLRYPQYFRLKCYNGIFCALADYSVNIKKYQQPRVVGRRPAGRPRSTEARRERSRNGAGDREEGGTAVALEHRKFRQPNGVFSRTPGILKFFPSHWVFIGPRYVGAGGGFFCPYKSICRGRRRQGPSLKLDL